jgi:electron transport complex protein RnfB
METAMADDAYQKLARHLDEHVVGFPSTPTSIKILEVLFPGQEAEIALKLTFETRTAAQCQEVMPEFDDLQGRLDAMACRGTVFTEQKPGQERVYRLLPSIVGFSETPFWSGRATEMTERLSPLWLEFFVEKFGEELERGVPLVRVIPISESLVDDSEVLPFDAIEENLEGQSFMAVAHCPCRQMRRYTGGGCEHSLENCLHLGSMARYMVEQGMARRIEKDDVLQILQDATREGMVHICDNLDGVLTTICNCCPCCCAFLTTMKLGHDSLARSSYVASVSAEDCVGCGACGDRCPVGAVKLGDEDVAFVDESVCIGCGVCTPWCATETMALVRRAEPKAPPEVVEFVTARLKTV